MDFTKYCVCTKFRNLQVDEDGELVCTECKKKYHSELQKALWMIEGTL